MPKTGPFERHTARYADWFARHEDAYRLELEAVRQLWPEGADGVEIGVGAGHFAAPLGIRHGVEPADAMRVEAVRKGIVTLEGVAERLPFPDGRFDAALMVTTICFVDDPALSVREMVRVVRPGGCAVIAFVDRAGALGQAYERRRAESVFYADARFVDVPEVAGWMVAAGLGELDYRQTLMGGVDNPAASNLVKPGFGEGAFVVVRGLKGRAGPC